MLFNTYAFTAIISVCKMSLIVKISDWLKCADWPTDFLLFATSTAL